MDPVQQLLFRAGLLPPPPMLAMGCKGWTRDTRPIDPLTGHFITSKEPDSEDKDKEVEETEETQ
ncbi:hypothetical protein QJS04_geneDACA012974 [Acorus gramineus]|uniref:Uncharacterized protein n=1 Tax=Acorus gramineus TaxID=55184 RepID=A0AAV9B7R3_ACOGR|nr:hypothetical protein QJS04_geneDACA012974 [Acorus gramineus]